MEISRCPHHNPKRGNIMRNIYAKIINKDIEVRADNINSLTICKDGVKVSAERGTQYGIEIVSEKSDNKA